MEQEESVGKNNQESSPFNNSPFSNSPFSNSPFSNSPFSNSPFSNSLRLIKSQQDDVIQQDDMIKNQSKLCHPM
jgi:hypothetical protein